MKNLLKGILLLVVVFNVSLCLADENKIVKLNKASVISSCKGTDCSTLYSDIKTITIEMKEIESSVGNIFVGTYEEQISAINTDKILSTIAVSEVYMNDTISKVVVANTKNETTGLQTGSLGLVKSFDDFQAIIYYMILDASVENTVVYAEVISPASEKIDNETLKNIVGAQVF